MSLLFETIRIQNGEFQNLSFHKARVENSRKEIFNACEPINLQERILIPGYCRSGVFKCKILYDVDVKSIAFETYAIRRIGSLKLIEDNAILYNYKFVDRTKIDRHIANKGNYDDILIVKNGLVTDTSYANIVFFDGKNWITSSAPLLQGTMRSYLLKNGLIAESKISPDDLRNYTKARLINAMLPLDAGTDIPVQDIGY